MLKKSVITALICLAAVAPASADIKKGQKAYLKQCKKCHGNGTKGAAMKSQDEWEEAFEDNAEIFKEWHAGTKGESYSKGKRFKKYAADLKDFLYEYGNDSGNVPSCG